MPGGELADLAERLRAGVEAGDVAALSVLLHPEVRWGGETDTDDTCHGRRQVVAWYAQLHSRGVRARVRETVVDQDTLLLGMSLTWPATETAEPSAWYQLFRVRDGLIVDIRDYPDRAQAVAASLRPAAASAGPEAVGSPRSTQDPVALAAVQAIHTGDVPALRRLLGEYPGLASARLGDTGTSRTLVHVATDWPGHYPNGPAVVAVLVEAGADVNARFAGPHDETPLHWAASSDDVAVLDALLDAGADIDADGAVIAGGTPLTDARAFGQWQAARRLVERGAQTTIDDAAALGLVDRLDDYFTGATPPPAPEEVDRAFWCACHGGQRATAEYLLARGAKVNWIPDWEELTPLDAAARSEASDLVAWLRGQGATSAAEPG